MTVEVDRDALLSAVRHVGDVVESRHTLPILRNLLVEATGGRLIVTGTNLDIEATAHLEATGDLAVTVDADKLLAAVQSLAPGSMTIAPIEGRPGVMLKRAKGQRTLATLPTQDFPKRQPLQNALRFSMAGASLLRLLDTTHPAMSTEEVRYYLSGVLLAEVDGQIHAVATDTHRLIKAECAAPDGAQGLPRIIVPSKTVTTLRRLLAKFEGDVTVEVEGMSALQVQIGNARILSKLVEGTFPDYARFIPAEGMHKFRVRRDALIDPVEAVAAVINAEGDKIKLRGVTIDLKQGDEHEVRARDNSGSAAREPFDVEYDGEPIMFGMNRNYVSGVVGVFAEDAMLSVSLNHPEAPVLFFSDKDPDLLAMIMPMHAQGAVS
jgi:DNA polymerase-3 subunit beta